MPIKARAAKIWLICARSGAEAGPSGAGRSYWGLTGRTRRITRSVSLVLGREFPGVLRAAAGGDERGFAKVWRDARPPVLRYLRVVAGGAAEDVAGGVWRA